MITVINGKTNRFLGNDKIYISRENKTYSVEESVLKNIFIIRKDGTRNEIIAKYRAWLWKEFNKKGAVYKELIRIAIKVKAGENIQLVCWCKPLDCHGDVIKRCIEWIIKEELI